MNISTSSPMLTLLFVFALLWILMDVDAKALSRTARWITAVAVLLLCAINQLLCLLLEPSLYGKLLFLNMHLPVFLLFLYIARKGVIKTAFMILTALVFCAPTTIVTKILHNRLGADLPILLLSNFVTYALMLVLARFVFRSVFNYFLLYGNNRFFLLLSLVPLAYYIYVLAYANIDISSLLTPAGYLVRLLPNAEVFFFYFLLPYIYKSLREKQTAQSAQDALQQKLASTEDQIALLSETNAQMAVYRHDARHQLLLLDGLLASGNTQQVQAFIKNALSDLDNITPKRFCENETVNLLCSSYDSKAKRLGLRLTIQALLPKELPLSDTELCSVVSNGLENALVAASHPELSDKWVAFYCEVKQDKLFMQIKNPYAGQVTMRNGQPVSTQPGHGYGCHSIQTIVQRNNGLCSFEAENGIFTLRIVLPLTD